MTDITSRAMLANLSIHQWTAMRHDKRISDEVAENHGALKDRGRYSKYLVPKDAMKQITAAANKLREHHVTNTLPWLDDGYRMLPAANYLAYTAEQQKLRVMFDEAVAEFIDQYPRHIERARVEMGDMFKASDFPLPHRLGNSFGVDLTISPIPDRKDFRVDLSKADIAKIRGDIEKRTQDALDAANRDLWDRIHSRVSHMADRLQAYVLDPETGKLLGVPFRDSMIENMRGLVDLLPRLNMTGDAQLEAMRLRLENELCLSNAEELRQSGHLRERVTRSAESILADMAGYLEYEAA